MVVPVGGGTHSRSHMSVTAGFSEAAEAAQGTFQTAQEATNLHMLAFEAAVVKRFSRKGGREMNNP